MPNGSACLNAYCKDADENHNHCRAELFLNSTYFAVLVQRAPHKHTNVMTSALHVNVLS
jgi:hypothetical protein